MSDLAEFLAVRAHALVHRFASWVTSIPVGLVLASRVICSPQSASFPFVLLPLRFRPDTLYYTAHAYSLSAKVRALSTPVQVPVLIHECLSLFSLPY